MISNSKDAHFIIKKEGTNNGKDKTGYRDGTSISGGGYCGFMGSAARGMVPYVSNHLTI